MNLPQQGAQPRPAIRAAQVKVLEQVIEFDLCTMSFSIQFHDEIEQRKNIDQI